VTFWVRAGGVAGLLLAAICCMVAILAHPPSSAIAGSNTAAEVTFNRDIARIIFHSCSSCHRPGEAAPFSLLTY